MSTTNDTRPTKTVTPHLVCADASAAIDFYQRAFNAEERFRLPGPDGKGIMHACIQIGDSPVFLVDENPQWGSHSPTSLKGTPVTIHLQVENVDELYASPVAANDHLYLISLNGKAATLAAGDKLKVVWQTDFKETTAATPAIAGDTLFVRTATKLYAFGKGQ